VIDRVMPKYYKKRYYRGGRDKYSIEQTAGTMTTNSEGDSAVPVVPAATFQGMRKVKHITVSIADAVGASSAAALFWAVVYVPQGTSLSTISLDSGPMYEPNQFVMGCGVFDFNGGPLTIRCPLSRNLNSGDYIALVVKKDSAGAGTVYNYVVRYAITLQ